MKERGTLRRVKYALSREVEMCSKDLGKRAKNVSSATNTIDAGEAGSQGISTPDRPNPVAAEFPVNAAGSCPKAGGAERELFSEDTETVLIFEDGAVIRLLATVTPGQLIFLTNLRTKQEVVCQVLRKRLLRSAGCYVELQFTEKKKAFWDAPPMQRMPGGAAVTLEALAEAAAKKGDKPAAKAATTVREAKDPSKKLTDTLVPEAKELLPTKPGPAMHSGAAGTDATAENEAHALAESSPQDDLLPEPELDFSQVAERAVVKKHDASLLQKPIPEIGQTTRKIIWTVVLLVLLGVGVRYGHWLDFLPHGKKGETTSTGQAVRGAVAERPGAVEGKSSTRTDKERIENSEPAATRVNEASPEKTRETAENNGAGREGKSETSATVEAEAPSKKADAASVGEGPMMPAKLVKSVIPVYPAEAIKGFITGDVKAEVVVEPTGHVGEVKVVSGPTQLRAAAAEALKQYQFSPATRDGKPVGSKVMVTVRFWFNP